MSVSVVETKQERRRRVRSGLPAEPDLSQPWPKRLLRRPLFWLTLVMLVVYAVLLTLLYQRVVPDQEVPGGTLPGIGTEAIPIAAKYAAITAVPLSLLFLWADRFRPQRFWVWLMTFGWGACVATFLSAEINSWAAGQLSIAGDGDPATGPRAAIYVAPWVEEAAKGTVLFWLAILMRYQWVSRLSGVVLAGLSGAAFAFVENILYYGRVYRYAARTFGEVPPLEALQQLFVLRGLMTFFGHPLFTAMTGIGLAVSLRSKSKIVRVVAPLAGYCAAAFLHMLFNATASLVSGWNLLLMYVLVALPLVVGLAVFIVRQLRREGRLIRQRLSDYTRVGWLPEDDPEPLSRLRTRLRALWHALFRGPETFLDTIRLQRAATELAYLRDSIARGLVDDAGVDREKILLAKLRALHGSAVVRPVGRAPYPSLRRRPRTAVEAYQPASYPGPSGLGGNYPAPPDTGGIPLGQTATQYSEVDPELEAAAVLTDVVDLEAALAGLRDALAPIELRLDLPGADTQRAAAVAATKQLDDYVLPRLAEVDAPLLAVIGGSTGAGKSTLVNSLLRREVSPPGVIRPTTRAPVLVHHTSDAHWFSDARILPGLARATGFDAGATSGDVRSLRLVPDQNLPPGLALLDAPDIDSVVAENRALAAQLLAAADLWLFVTSAARYADAVPWDFLAAAAKRSAAVAVVLDRVPPRAMEEVPPHLGQLMTDRGLASSPLFAVPETSVDQTGLLPDAAVAPIRSWLATVAADQASRARVVRQTLDGAIVALQNSTPDIADALDRQAETLDQLRAQADHSYAEAVRTISVQTEDGTLLRGEVLARWHEFVGTGEFFRALEQKIGWLRDRVTSLFKGEPPGAANLKVAVESGLEALLRAESDAAAERAEAAWQAHPAGRQLLAGAEDDLTRSSPDFTATAARVVRDWQGAVLDLVADEGMSKRSKARFLALGVNGVGVALMIVVFAHTGGLVGAEIGVAGGTAVLAQRVLEAVFGDQAVRRLAETAKAELDARVEALVAAELLRYHGVLDRWGGSREQAAALRVAAAAVAIARVQEIDHRPDPEPPGHPELAGVPVLRALESAPAGEVLEGRIITEPAATEPAATEPVREERR